MSSLKSAFLFFLMAAALVASAEVTIVDGKRYECKDGLCVLVEDEEGQLLTSGGDAASPLGREPRIAQGYMSADEFVAFLENREVKGPFAETGVWVTLLLVLLGGLAMNLTPCVLPMIPINLMIIGRSVQRGAAYGLGMAVAYGALGVAAAVGGLAFGAIQGNPWFNAAVAVIFVALALALFEVWVIDLSKLRSGVKISDKRRGRRFPVGGDCSSTQTTQTILLPFSVGALSAVLAGACVAPILISVLLLTGKLYAEGKVLALGLPFVLGLGMALPWPFLGAGLKVLPKPGAWMKWVNRVFGVVVIAFACWYGRLAWEGFASREGAAASGEADSCPLQNKEGRILTSGEDAASPLRSGKDSASPLSGEDAPRIAPPSELASLGGYASPLNVTPSTLHLHLTPTPERPSTSESAKPILVDCWATWCKNCAAMDRVLEEPEVKRALKSYRIIRVQAEDISELRKVKGFESIRGLPAFVVFD